MKAKAWAWKAVELFMTTSRRETWKQKPHLPDHWALGACLSTCGTNTSLTKPVSKSFIWLIHCFSPFTSQDLKTMVHFWLLGTWAQPSRIKKKTKQKKPLLLGLISGQASAVVRRGASPGRLQVLQRVFKLFLRHCFCI